ncbi:MAG: NTP transferase domain-containing protein [Candidatus Moranbacteria bacterium]|nr:NTP transferase domain-containing protein [Candidatus Moranbacteria bacterium]
MSITGIILAGGLGTRMEGVCKGVPKAVLEFNGSPFIVHQVLWLMGVCNEIIIAAGHNSDGISSIFRQEVWRGMGIRVVGEQSPLGTGGAIRLAATRASNELIFVCNGDTVVSDVDVRRIAEIHVMRRSQITAVLTKNDDMVQNCGAITVRDNLVIGFDEGKGERRIRWDNASSTGCYIMNRRFVLENFETFGERTSQLSLERELLPLFVSRGLVDAVVGMNRYVIDFGKPDRYERLKRIEDSVLPAITLGAR